MTSAGFTPAATTSTTTSPSPGTGSGTSSRFSTSGPPGEVMTTARMGSSRSQGIAGYAVTESDLGPTVGCTDVPGTLILLRMRAGGERPWARADSLGNCHGRPDPLDQRSDVGASGGVDLDHRPASGHGPGHV